MKNFIFICLLITALAIEHPLGNYACTKAGFAKYLKEYPDKCADDCSEKGQYFQTHVDNYIGSCKYVKAKSDYVAYDFEMTYLTDFSDEEVEGLFTITPEYTGAVTSCETDDKIEDFENVKIEGVSLDNYCEDGELRDVVGRENLNCTTSWATQTIKIAEYSLKQQGIEEKLSAKYLFECMRKEYGDDGCNGYVNKDIYDFIENHGLMTETQAAIMGENLCEETETDEGMYKFQVKTSECNNRFTLMRELAEGRPQMVLLALNGQRVRHILDIASESDAPFTGAYDDPTTWAIVTGYELPTEEKEEGAWIIQTNFHLCETVQFKLPMRNNDTNANYAGIAAYAFYLESLAPTALPTEEPPTEEPPTEAPEEPTTEAPEEPTTEAPTEAPEEPTTEAPTTEAPTTEAPTTEAPTTEAPTTEAPTTEAPTTLPPTTLPPTTLPPRREIIDGDVSGECKEQMTAIVSPETVTDLVVRNCIDLHDIEFSQFPSLRTLNMNDVSGFESFSIEDMKYLTSVDVANMGETELLGVCSMNSTVSISHNPVLEKLIIQGGSFGTFCSMQIVDNPAVMELGIGAAYNRLKQTYTYNNGVGAFFATTDAVIMNMPLLEEIHVAGNVLTNFKNLAIENLPTLKTFSVFSNGMQGNENGASLTMKNISPLTTWTNDVEDTAGSAFSNIIDLDMDKCEVPYEGIKLATNAFSRLPHGSTFKNSPGFQQWWDEKGI